MLGTTTRALPTCLAMCLALCLALAPTPWSATMADDEQLPHEVISTLGQRLNAVGATSGKHSEMRREVDEAIEKIEWRTAQGDDSTLTARDHLGRTPLIAAAHHGYAEIVEALLDAGTVRAAIDAIDDRGLSASDHATLAFHQSIWACQNLNSGNMMRWLPRIMMASWYASEDPYTKLQVLLGDAGATMEIERARAVWLTLCTQQSRETRDAVTNTNTLQQTLIEQGELSFKRVMEGVSNRR